MTIPAAVIVKRTAEGVQLHATADGGQQVVLKLGAPSTA